MRNLLLLLLFFCSSCFVVAQESSGVFRYGKLKNGLTYYIRHTEVQPGYADYYLVQNVGSLLEDTIRMVWLMSWNYGISLHAEFSG
ncbi:MAG: hypothetical protein ACLUDU_03420 [Butyricimonas faecihominis]